jgi:hypothetical protein
MWNIVYDVNDRFRDAFGSHQLAGAGGEAEGASEDCGVRGSFRDKGSREVNSARPHKQRMICAAKQRFCILPFRSDRAHGWL